MSRAALAAVLVYGLALGVSFLVFPPLPATHVDTFLATEGRGLFVDPAGYLVFSREPLALAGKDVIITGASDSLESFRPDQIQERCPAWNIHNFAIGSANIEEDIQTLKLYYEVAPPKAHVVVAGLRYTRFLPAAIRYGDLKMPLKREMLRYGMYRQLPDGTLTAVVPPRWQPWARVGLRPVLWGSRIALWATGWINVISGRGKYWLGILEHEGLERPKQMLTRMYRLYVLGADNDAARELTATLINEQELLDYYARDMRVTPDALPSAEYDRLLEFADLVGRHDGKLVLIDMPIPRWHADGSPHDHHYREVLPGYLRRLDALPNVTFASFRDIDDRNLFYDGNHPNPTTRRMLAGRLVELLRTIGACS